MARRRDEKRKAHAGGQKMKKLLILAMVAFVPAAGASYKCVDEKGVTRIGDTPPPECDHVPMYEMSSSGSILKRIDPTPSPDQLKGRQEEMAKAKEAERAAADQKRKDTALLASYSEEKEFDVARDRNVEPLTGRIKSTQDRQLQVDKRIQELEDEMEFYKAGKSAKSGKAVEAPALPLLIANLDRARGEKVSLEKTLDGYQKQIEEIKAKFDADKKRWVALKTGTADKPASEQPNPRRGMRPQD
jgi:hypothetical protein